MVDKGILFSNTKPPSRMLNEILTLDQLKWLPYRSDFSQIWRPWYRAWFLPNYEWFLWSICNGCGMPAGNTYPSGHLVPSLLGVGYVPIIEISFPQLAVSFLQYSLWIFLGTLSIFPFSCRPVFTLKFVDEWTVIDINVDIFCTRKCHLPELLAFSLLTDLLYLNNPSLNDFSGTSWYLTIFAWSLDRDKQSAIVWRD